MKKIFVIVLITISLSKKAQIIRGFVGVSGYLDGDFEKSLFVGGNLGAEFKMNRFIKPEIDISYYYGSRENEKDYGSQGQLPSIYSSLASAINFNFCPKICIGNDGHRDTYLVILPKYSFFKVTAVGNCTTLNAITMKMHHFFKDILLIF
jgi:hypothetical protein